VVIVGEDVGKVKEDVREFRKDFQKVHFCFENATEAYQYVKIR
jgi:glycine hydroxymethyltransferase